MACLRTGERAVALNPESMDVNTDSPESRLPLVQRVTAVLWPSFLMAGVATVVFFTFLDPREVLVCSGEPPISRTGAYSLGFFGFWLLTAASSAATGYFLRPQPGRRHGPATEG